MFVVLWIFVLFFVPESPKWQFENGRYMECKKSLQYMASINGRIIDWELPETSLPENKIDYNTKNENIRFDQVDKPSSMLSDIRKEALNLVCMIVVWVTCSFCYYLISY